MVAISDPTTLQPKWLENVAELESWLARDTHLPVAVDSEFERVHTFYARPGLVQLARADEAWLVEPDVAAASAEFVNFLADANRIKWLYALSEDADLFREWLGVELKGALDVQLGAAFAGAGMSVGFARLVEGRLGVALDKSQTRSDWLARPLSLAQQQYALADVVYLLPLADQLMQEVEARGFLAAWREESDRFITDLAQQLAPETYYLRLRNAWRFDPQQLRALRRLCAWRERRCRELDRPRNRVVGDKLLVSIVEAMPGDLRALGRVRDVPPVVVRKHGEAMLAILSSTDDDEPVQRIRPPLNREQQAIYKRAKRLIQSTIEPSGIPMELVAARRKLEPAVQTALEQGGGLPAFLAEGWRAELTAPVHEPLEALLSHG